MQSENHSPLPHMVFSNTDNKGREFGVVVIKAALDIDDSGACLVAREQEPFNFSDKTYGELNQSSLRYPSDLVSFKPATDVIVNAIAHSPDGAPSRSWIAGLEVEDSSGRILSHSLRVSGPRFWEPRWPKALNIGDSRKLREVFGWSLSTPEEITKLPIRYEFAFGGTQEVGTTADGKPKLTVDERNPLGRGWVHEKASNAEERVAAPQIEWCDDPVTTLGKLHNPAGLGAIPPAWLPRRSLGGTFDQHWIDEVWPKWPADYDFAFNNSAACGLSVRPYLVAPLEVRLTCLRCGNPTFVLRVPHIVPIAAVQEKSGAERFVKPNLDTVVLDIDGDDLFDCRVLLTWRMAFDREGTERLVILDPLASDNTARARSAENAPHPNDCGTYCAIMEVRR